MDIDYINLTRLSFIIIVSSTSLLFFFFFYFSAAKRAGYPPYVAKSFSLFFLASGIGFITFAALGPTWPIVSVICNNILFPVAFSALKQGFMLRRGHSGYRFYKDKVCLVVTTIMLLTNLSLFYTMPDNVWIRTMVFVIGLSVIVITTKGHVALNNKNLQTGEVMAIWGQYFALFAVWLANLVMFLTGNGFLYLVTITVTYTVVIAVIGATIENLLLTKLVEKFKEEARHDFLTNLLNRRSFIETANDLLSLSKRTGLTTSVVILDIDDFKFINDTFGHDCGDSVLSAVAKIIEGNLRTEDITARIGGEEFAILMPNTNAEQAKVIIERLKGGVSNTIIPSHICDIRVSASFGICELQMSDQDLISALNKADKALYVSKNQGKNMVSVYTSSMEVH